MANPVYPQPLVSIGTKTCFSWWPAGVKKTSREAVIQGSSKDVGFVCLNWKLGIAEWIFFPLCYSLGVLTYSTYFE